MTARFDALIHAPTRLGLVSLLAAVDSADFKFLRDQLELSDSALSKQLTTLDEAGYIEIRKGFVGRRPRTSVRLTAAGRAAFDGHVAALRAIIERSPEGGEHGSSERLDRSPGAVARRPRADL